MNIDLGSFAYGSSLEVGTGTPSWGTSLGQASPEYYFTKEGYDRIIIGMAYCAVPLETVSLPLGKGGRIVNCYDAGIVQIASVFNKVFINNVVIEHPFIIVLVKEESESHFGRRSIKYAEKSTYDDGERLISNLNFKKKVYEKLGLSDTACWFVYDIDVKNHEELHLSAIIVDKENNVGYADSHTRSRKWTQLINEPSSQVGLLHSGVKYASSSPLDLPYQSIYYGTPGTGKSHTAKLEEAKFDKVFRTTFHPEYDYASFVGCYKPKTDIVDNTKVIIYDFDPQVFTKAYEYAWSRPEKKVLLLIEEINRGNCAQIFGDLFQLLDRDNNGESKYPINVDLDMLGYLKSKLQESHPEAVAESQIKLPGNFYIIATMNTSDQSLFPMDSAFKRRWVWKYFPITEYTQRVFKIKIAGSEYKWWDFIQEVNKRIESVTMSPDKQIGYWFINPESNVIESEEFVGKVLFYLWNDVFKDYPDNNDSPFVNIKFKDMFKVDGSPCEDTIIKFMQGLNLMNNNERNTIPFTSSEQALPLAAEPLAED